MRLTDWIARNSTLSSDELFGPFDGAVRLTSYNGVVAITHWDDTRIGWRAPNAALLAEIAALPDAASHETLFARLHAARRTTLTAGVLVHVAFDVNVRVDGVASTIADLASLRVWGAEHPTVRQPWIDNDNHVTIMTGDEFVSLAIAVGEWLKNVYQTAAAAVGKIRDGSIQTVEQIDAIVWPVS